MTESALRIALHVTARITFAFFVCAFAGNALRDLWPGRFSLWLSRNRDWFLVAMAASHTFHLAAIIAFFQVVGWSKLQLVTVLGGGFVYLLIYALAATAITRLRRDGHEFLAGSPRLEAEVAGSPVSDLAYLRAGICSAHGFRVARLLDFGSCSARGVGHPHCLPGPPQARSGSRRLSCALRPRSHRL
jgi:hypothetical protein